MHVLLQQQIKDAHRGALYRTGAGLDDLIPKEVQEIENDLLKRNEVTCKLLGCHGKNHKTKASKLCKYYSCKDKEELRMSMDNTLRLLYPQHYGKDLCPSIPNK